MIDLMSDKYRPSRHNPVFMLVDHQGEVFLEETKMAIGWSLLESGVIVVDVDYYVKQPVKIQYQIVPFVYEEPDMYTLCLPYSESSHVGEVLEFIFYEYVIDLIEDRGLLDKAETIAKKRASVVG